MILPVLQSQTLLLMPKDSLGTVQEGNSLVQDDVEIENTQAVL